MFIKLYLHFVFKITIVNRFSLNFILLIFPILFFGQDDLVFNKRNVQCEDKWVAFQMNSDSTYTFGFIYIDAQAGLTFNNEGKFKINPKGKFIKIESEEMINTSLKSRLKPNKILLTEIPKSKFKELKIVKFPEWLKIYKSDEDSIERLYRWGYLYNEYNEFEKALTYLVKADKIDPNFKGLQTEIAFSYNTLGNYELALIALKKSRDLDPNNCYTLKEVAYSYTKLTQLDKVIETYNKMKDICAEKNYVSETAYNLAYEYFKIKDKTEFYKWKTETEKLLSNDNQYYRKLKLMENELNK